MLTQRIEVVPATYRFDNFPKEQYNSWCWYNAKELLWCVIHLRSEAGTPTRDLLLEKDEPHNFMMGFTCLSEKVWREGVNAFWYVYFKDYGAAGPPYHGGSLSYQLPCGNHQWQQLDFSRKDLYVPKPWGDALLRAMSAGVDYHPSFNSDIRQIYPRGYCKGKLIPLNRFWPKKREKAR
jgi:hypothetical protein